MKSTPWLTTPLYKRRRLLATLPLNNPKFLDIVRAPRGWGVFASAGPNFRHAVFGRDSIEVAAALCSRDRWLTHDIILALARLQGTKFDQLSEEEPGKIHHEYRAVDLGGIPAPDLSVDIMRKLQTTWGDIAHDQMLYYGSYDATPLYIRLVQQYAQEYGSDILDQTYTNHSGAEQTIRSSVLLAAEWLAGKLRERPDHLLAYRRLNPQGLDNQVWKDSRTSYLFSDGSLPNFDAGIVSVELQGYAYDALLYAAELSVEKGGAYKQLAEDVQASTLQKLWMPEEQFFAQGIATDLSGNERLLDNCTSNGALLLDSRLLADLPADQSARYAAGIRNLIMSPDFHTPAGIRCRAVRHSRLLEYVDYHGTYAVWPKETFNIARGLERFGFNADATTLRSDIIRTVQRAGDFYELFYVDLDGMVWHDPVGATARFSSATVGEPLPTPEPGQAWTISAAIASSYLIPHKPGLALPHVTAIKNAWQARPVRNLPKLPSIPHFLQSVQAVLIRRARQK